MNNLLGLPSELLASIFQHLEDKDFFATRRTCKTLEEASVTLYGRRFFRKKGYMITTPSLDVLERLSTSAKLGRYVQHVWFNPDCYTFITPACAPEQDIDCDDAENESEDERVEIVHRVDLLSEEDRPRWHAYCECMQDHVNLLQGAAYLLQRRLEQIFANLPRLKILGMRRSEDHSPWGWRRLTDAVGEDPRVLGPVPFESADTLSDSTKLFAAMASAAATEGTRLQRLYTDAVEVDNIPTPRLSSDLLRSTMHTMLYLEINVSKAFLRWEYSPYYRMLDDESKFGDGLLRVFQSAAPSLLELGLQVFPELSRSRWTGGVPARPIHWDQFYQYLTFQKIVDHVQFRHLTRLKLEKIVTTSTLLEAFLAPSKAHLTSLKLRDTRLVSSDSTQEIPRPWEPIFTFLHTSLPKLSYLLLYQLLHARGGVTFVEATSEDSTSTQTVSGPHGNLDGPVAGGTFAEYESITLEAKGREEVLIRLGEVRERHWYEGSVYSYAMDDAVWHTDTSDEEW